MSNLCESDPSDRTDGQIETLPRPWEVKMNRMYLANIVMMIALIVKPYMTWMFKKNGLVNSENATDAVEVRR